ncbi:MAG TPA: murein L,D-transpeptidase catalytic domain family protein [Thermoanaerobaculia bacterium]|nr:murein L,D-transpeptidase catalytic domain family protein [Thermoanaerobaculia bacterium]
MFEHTRPFAAGTLVRAPRCGASARRLFLFLFTLVLSPILPAAASAQGPLAAAAVTPSGPAKAVWRDVQGLSPRALTLALDAVQSARAQGASGRDDLLTLIDYSLPSTQPRLWVLDLEHGKVLYHELVAHGAGSGENYAVRFSNAMNSRQTSLGLFLTGDTYEGGNGYSLRLRGLDAGVNDLAAERSIVIHGAWYVSSEQAQRYGRLGRSWGCPALPPGIAHTLIDTIKRGSFVYAYAAHAANTAATASSPRALLARAGAGSSAARPVSAPSPAVAGTN